MPAHDKANKARSTAKWLASWQINRRTQRKAGSECAVSHSSDPVIYSGSLLHHFLMCTFRKDCLHRGVLLRSAECVENNWIVQVCSTLRIPRVLCESHSETSILKREKLALSYHISVEPIVPSVKDETRKLFSSCVMDSVSRQWSVTVYYSVFNMFGWSPDNALPTTYSVTWKEFYENRTAGQALYVACDLLQCN